MYRTVLKYMEEENLTHRAPRVFESLYQDSKGWGKAKPPKQMQIHVQNYPGKLHHYN